MRNLVTAFPRGDWIIEPVAVGVPWTAPTRCEVYVSFTGPGLNNINDNIGGTLAFAAWPSMWYPAYVAATAMWEFDKIDPVTGILTYAGGDPEENINQYICKASDGWILSAGEQIVVGADYFVRWRPVVNR